MGVRFPSMAVAAAVEVLPTEELATERDRRAAATFFFGDSLLIS